MANKNFVVQNGLQVGPLTIDAATGSISTTGTVSISGLAVSSITKNDSSITINDTGTNSNITFVIDGGTEHVMTSTLTTLNGNLKVNDVGYLQVPAGTSAQRPGSPANGMMRYNSSITSFEGYYAGAWSSLGGVKSVDGKAYITAEASAGAGDDVIRVYAGDSGTSTEVMWASTSNIKILPTTASTSSTTGALQVAGGAGIAGELFVGGNISSASTGFIKVPVGTTAQRPGSPAAGQIRYNSSTSSFEGYGTAWASLGGVKSVDQLTYIQAETSPGASNDQLEFFAANSGSTTTRVALMDYQSTSLNGNLYVSPVTNGVNQAKIWAQGAGALTNAVFTGYYSDNNFIQMALYNPNGGISASSDFIAYADTGDDTQGYIDMGINNSGFADPTYQISKAGDGYIFMSGPAGTGGNLILVTADGTHGDIVFAAGGFGVGGTVQGRFIANDGLSVTGNITAEGGAIYQGTSTGGVTARDLTLNVAVYDVSSEVSSLTHTTTTFTLTYNVGTTNLSSAAINDIIEIAGYTGSQATAINGYHTITNINTGSRTVTFTISGATGSGTITLGVASVTLYGPGHRVGLTNASGIFTGEADGFVQFALKNYASGTSASTDVIAYASNGDNESGWIDMGITGENFNDATFGVTGPNDGYIFMSAPNKGDATPSGNGDLYISTSNHGAQNDIVFSTNGFESGKERMRIIGQDRVGKSAGVEIYIPTTSTSTSTGALRISGGLGLQGNLYVGGNFNLTGNITIGGTGSTTSTSTLVVENPITFLANANAGNSQDIGMVGQYVSGTTKYTGVVREASTGGWRVFDGVTTKPTTTVTWSQAVNGNIMVGSALVANTTASISTTTGALVVAGGVGIAGAVTIGGHITTEGVTATGATGTGNFVFSASPTITGHPTIEGVTATGATGTGNFVFSASPTVTGTLTTAAITASSTVQPSGNATVNLGGSSAYWNNFYAAGVTTNGITVGASGGIQPAANASVNIGSSSSWFNNIYGTATHAQYADLAENYQADRPYNPGTVLMFGGAQEVTIADSDTRAVAGVVSTNPAHLMNGALTGPNVVAVAFTGRVPCNVIGPVKKGDLMVSAGFGFAKVNNDPAVGTVIGKALQDYPMQAKGIIEVVVGRF